MITILPALILGASEIAPEEALQHVAPVVVELFTSQSCSSCPPAEANLRELAKEENVIALEWHVNYWDDLHAGQAGNWKDPFSSAANTARQREYNLALRGRAAVYTPQVVINGAAETVGSRRGEVRQLIDRAISTFPSAIVKTEKIGNRIKFTVSSKSAEAILVTFQDSALTRVSGGENRGRVLAEVNVVTGFRKLGDVENGQASFFAKTPNAGSGCALLIQEADTGMVLSGAYCPA